MIINILCDAQYQIRRRLHHAFSVAQPVRRKLCSLQALHTAGCVVKATADRLPTALTAHPALGVENVLRLQYLRRLTKNPPLPVIQFTGELHVQAAQRVDGALGIEQTGSSYLGMPLPVTVPPWLSQPPVRFRDSAWPPAPHGGGAVGQLPALKRQVAAALQGTAVIIEQAGCTAVNGKGLLRGQFTGTVEDIACGIQCQASAGLQPPAGIVERLRAGGDLMTALCGAVSVIPTAACLDG